ncbi:hypothetical protein ABFT23_04160 [Nocardioides sp. C4-1]|uniref:hypothetical protein n=1 Tax=Nocardioides sp. C4-1 TaxID=3151851 RepID=UPI0032652BD7
MNDTDLFAALNRAIGTGPAIAPPEHRVTAGRRALLRLRLITAAGALAVLVAAGGTLLAVTGDDGGPSTAPVATDGTTPTPTPSTSPSPTPSEAPESARPADGADLELTADGELLVAEGVEVLQRIDNPLGLEAPDRSVAVAYTRDGAETWALLDHVRGAGGSSSGGTSSDPARKAFATLEQWIADQVAIREDTPTSTYVAFAGGGERLRPRPGVTMLAQTSDVDLPDFAGPGDDTAAAMVRDPDGVRWFVLARRTGGAPADYLTVAGEVGGPDLAAFLDYAAEQYGSGEGVR